MQAVICESKANGCQRKWYKTENKIDEKHVQVAFANVLEESMQEEVM
jgi:hypothetical protein